jgi:hypothetical protein
LATVRTIPRRSNMLHHCISDDWDLKIGTSY